jgi:hypothetical protein
MGDDGIQELTRAAADLLAELAAVSAEGEALRRELEMTWGCLDDDQDSIPTGVPPSWDDLELELEPESRRDTLRC